MPFSVPKGRWQVRGPSRGFHRPCVVAGVRCGEVDPPPKGRAVTPEGGQGRGGPAEAAAHAQGCQGGGRRRFGGGNGLRFGGTGDWSGGLGGGGAGQRRPEGRGGEGSGPHLPPRVPPFRGRLLGRLREGAWRRKHCSDASSATFTASQVRSVTIKAKENVLFYDFL